jgi:signal transduction histidine kinase
MPAVLGDSLRSLPGGEPVAASIETVARAERLHIARELHDVVGHGLAAISLHAGAAARTADAHPEAALAALESIRATSRSVLDELRTILGQLREAHEGGEPARGIGTLDALVAATSDAGVSTVLHIVGPTRPLALALDQAAYRIVQEALANALRHAYGSRADVFVEYLRSRLVLTIENGPGGQASELPPSTGYGLRGMRERVAELGGALKVAPTETGGFRVRASLPFRASR